MPGGAVSFIALSIVLFAVLGSVLEGLPAIVLFAPLMFPIAKQFGVHEVHYSMIAILAMGVGLFTPPFGIGFYVTCAIGGCGSRQGVPPHLASISRRCWSASSWSPRCHGCRSDFCELPVE